MRILLGLAENFRPVALEPKDFRPHRLRCQRIAAIIENALNADPRSEFIDLLSGPRIHSVEHRIHQRFAGFIHRQHARPDGAGADGLDIGRIDFAVSEKFLGNEGDVIPPVFDRPMFRPARLRHQHLVGLCGTGNDIATVIAQNAPSTRMFQYRCRDNISSGVAVPIQREFLVNAGNPGDQQLREAHKIGGVAHLQGGMRVAAGKTQIDGGDPFMQQLHIG